MFICSEVRNKWREVISLPHCETVMNKMVAVTELVHGQCRVALFQTFPSCFQGQEFAEQYLLEYQREKDGPWFRFRNRRRQEVR